MDRNSCKSVDRPPQIAKKKKKKKKNLKKIPNLSCSLILEIPIFLFFDHSFYMTPLFGHK